MSKLLLSMALALVAIVSSFAAEALTPEQQEVKQFIEKMYSYDPDTFSFGDFSKKTGKPFLRNRVQDNSGKYEPAKQCALLREFYDELIIKQTAGNGVVQCDADFRYPGLAAEEESPDTRDITIPSPKIATPVVKGDLAKVQVVIEGEDIDTVQIVYFLHKTKQGWRVSNGMIHRRAPLDNHPECRYTFIKKPTAEEFKEVPPSCRELLPSNYRP
ncbi:MAG: hypothetical protein P4N59_24075 [Negativicutes bacterium]|nr:hypothetical protein [Negativicutes bacterium]